MEAALPFFVRKYLLFGGFAQYVNGRIKTARIKGRALEHVETAARPDELLGQLFFVRIQHGKSLIRQNTGQETE